MTDCRSLCQSLSSCYACRHDQACVEMIPLDYTITADFIILCCCRQSSSKHGALSVRNAEARSGHEMGAVR